MAKIIVGCAGWEYKDWIGPFYPKKLEPRDHLEYYSKFFNLVEINSTFYNLPSEESVKSWASRVPESFGYVVKAWQKITHDLNDPDLDYYVSQFFNRIKPLKEKLHRVLLQFPPRFKFSDEHLKRLIWLMKEIPSEYNYIIELRDNSWFDTKILKNIVEGTRIILGTTYMPGIVPYYLSNQKSYYIRLIGDRELTVFNRIQRKQEDALTDLKSNVHRLKDVPYIREIFIIVNNHFTGYAPGMANLIKKTLNLKVKEFNQQKTLTDFF